MPFVAFKPDAAMTAGKSTVAVVQTLTSMTAPSIVELNAATTDTIECAIEAFGSTTDASTRERKMLCDEVAVEMIGRRKYSMDSMTIMIGNPQTETISSKFPLDTVRYLVHRPGIAHTEAFKTGDKVQILEVRTTAVDYRTITTDEGDEYAIVVQFAVEARSQLWATCAD